MDNFFLGDFGPRSASNVRDPGWVLVELLGLPTRGRCRCG